MFSLRKIYKNKIWQDLYELKSADEAFTYFITYIKNMFNICCPEKQMQINYKNRHAWISTELKNKITKREELLIKKYKHPTLENIETYKKYKNKVLSELRKAESEFYRHELEMTKNDLRKSWKLIKNIVGKDQKIIKYQHRNFYLKIKKSQTHLK